MPVHIACCCLRGARVFATLQQLLHAAWALQPELDISPPRRSRHGSGRIVRLLHCADALAAGSRAGCRYMMIAPAKGRPLQSPREHALTRRWPTSVQARIPNQVMPAADVITCSAGWAARGRPPCAAAAADHQHFPAQAQAHSPQLAGRAPPRVSASTCATKAHQTVKIIKNCRRSS